MSIFNVLNKFIKNFGVQIKKTTSIEFEKKLNEKQVEAYNRIIELYNLNDENTINNEIEGLVFSKDRPLQLYALLKSYEEKVLHSTKLKVIYKASDSKIQTDYKELIKLVSSEKIDFIEEKDFYSQVLNWVKNNRADRLFFLTDDAIFIDNMDLNDSLNFNPLKELFCFRFGNDLDYCFAYDKKQVVPLFKSIIVNSYKNIVSWNWSVEDNNDWGYPLSVDGHIFYKNEIMILLENIHFNNPNSLEGNLQLYNEAFKSKKGVSYSNVKMINVPCNLTQNLIANRTTGFFTVEDLLLVWRSGKEIDIVDFYGLKAQKAMEKKYSFIKRLN